MPTQLRPNKKLIYLDHAATTPIAPQVAKAMRPFIETEYGNPSSLYAIGQKSSQALTQARQTIANILQASPKEIVFTAGGTESINMAIFGVARQYMLDHKQAGHIISTTIEHHAVLHSLEALKQEGWAITLIEVDQQGVVNLEKLKKAVKKNTALVTVMYANNEIGTIQPIAEIGKWLSGLNKARIGKKLPKIYFHSDACQAGNSLDLTTYKLGTDLLSVNGSKIYGPKQTGFLYVKTGTPIKPLIYGGGQERNLRSGTENVAGSVGLATAFELAQKNLNQTNKKVKILRDWLLTKILKTIKGAQLNGVDDRNFKPNLHLLNGGAERLPNNINISIQGIEGEAAMFYLDSYNVAVSTGSACTSTSTDPSHVLLALGKTAQDAYSSLRLTLGDTTTKADVEYAYKALKTVVEQLRKATKI